MSDKRVANVRMEEAYMRLIIEYHNPVEKAEICRNVTLLEQKFDIYPEVIHRRENKKECFSTVEFSGGDYICSRTCGDFIEELLKNLNIRECVRD